MDELYQQIINIYKETGSVKKTAEELGTYPIKVRRVLITEGLWHSKTSEQVADLLAKGKSVAEIAEGACYIGEECSVLYALFTWAVWRGRQK